MDAKVFGRIILETKNGECFLHVLGDRRMYFDIDSLEYGHPEEKAFIELNRIGLEKALYRMREQLGSMAT